MTRPCPVCEHWPGRGADVRVTETREVDGETLETEHHPDCPFGLRETRRERA